MPFIRYVNYVRDVFHLDLLLDTNPSTLVL